MRSTFLFFATLAMNLICCGQQPSTKQAALPGAYQMDNYLPQLTGKSVGICTNQSGLINDTHLVDTLLSRDVRITKVFTPEHGFRGSADAGEKVDYSEAQQSYELISLYGKTRKPSKEDLAGVDIMVFDIQDVGVRFFTYISTMTLLMEACAENNIPLIIFDRPNPNGSYVDGPVMEEEYKSFLGMHPVPIVHGLTPGEFALMINGEYWLKDSLQCEIEVIKTKHWTHADTYSLPVKPSPNLPDDISISWYPSLCLFEQTICSVGRGTDRAFQHIGHPDYPDKSYAFTPRSRPGAKNPVLEGEVCFGEHYGFFGPNYKFTIQPLIDFYKKMDRKDFFKPYLHRLAGTKNLQKQIEDGWSQEAIKASWEPALSSFKTKREKYLLYE